MARLSYFRCEADFAFDQDRIRKVLGRIQFTDCKFFESIGRPNNCGSHGLLALDESTKLAVVAFRGTDADDPTDIGDDLNALPEGWSGGGKVHRGFANALMEIWDLAEKELQALQDFTLLFTGHSLGAAMATLAASLHTPNSLYTFGSPRVGDETFVAAIEGKLDNHRYVDCCDLVARVPPAGVFGYAHLGRPYYIDRDRAIQQRDFDDTYIQEDQFKAEAKYIEEFSWRIGDVAVRALADHSPVNYVWPVTAASR
jgi:Lipase (class 3)